MARLIHSLALACLHVLGCAASEPWEWGGVFNFPTAGHYVWSAARNSNGVYADASMKMVIVTASSADDAGLHGAEASAETLWNQQGSTWPTRSAGGELEANTAFNLVFEQRSWVTHFEVHVDAPGALAFFTEHAPTEFENGFHFFRTEDGKDMEAAAEEGGSGHAHGTETVETHCPWSHDWEWSGTFTLGAGYYTWNAARGKDGSFADATMNLIIVNAPNASMEALEETEEAAHTLWDAGSWTTKNTGDELQPGGAYTLTFDQHTWASHFYLKMTTAGSVAVYAQHMPTEFEKDFHYLKDQAGSDVEPGVQASIAQCTSPTVAAAATVPTHKKWGDVILGSFLTCLPTLLGPLFVIPSLMPSVREKVNANLALGSLNAFASGVLAAAAFFLLLPEALHLAGEGHDEEVVGTWTWGTSVLVGWFLCMVIKHVLTVLENRFKVDSISTEGNEDLKGTKNKFASMGIAGPVLIGDLFHNLADGLVIGTAFKLCGSTFGWELVGVTIAHEIPQEIADLAVLISEAKWKWWSATLANFICSLSTILGALITHGTDVGSNEEGYILAGGAGVYLFVAITELGNKIISPGKPTEMVAFLAAFVTGSVLLGLVLLGHEHCSPPTIAADGTVAASGGHHH